MKILPLHPPLSKEIERLRQELPLKPAPVTLSGHYVRLEPTITERDAAALYAVSNGEPVVLGERRVAAYDADELIWRFMFSGPFATVEEFTAYLQQRMYGPNMLAFTVFASEVNQPVGMATMMNNSPTDLKIELGNIWYSPLVQRTPANTEATYLLLNHLFGLGYRRVEWKCNALNERSRRAALRMGFQFEGIQENHLIIKNRNRDTAWYRILAHEWPAVKTHLEGLL
jgi:RimJ/RimL family protein N-acetyltransferase